MKTGTDGGGSMSRFIQLLLLFTAVTVLLNISAKIFGNILISEIMVNPEFSVSSGENSSSNEYLELYNNSAKSMDVSKLRLQYGAEEPDVLLDFPSATPAGISGDILPPGGYLLILPGGYANCWYRYITAGYTPSRFMLRTLPGSRLFRYGLNNTGGTVQILDAAGSVLDAVSWYRDPGKNNPLIPSSLSPFCSNWVIDPAGPSPGFGNRVQTVVPPDSRFAIRNRTANGHNGFVFSVRIYPGEECTIKVVDLHGQLIKTVADRCSDPGIIGFVWRGSSRRGTRARAGCYIVTYSICRNGVTQNRGRFPIGLYWK